MNHKVIVIVSALVLVTTVGVANCKMKQQGEDTSKMGYKKSHHKKRGNFAQKIVHLTSMLSLTSKQSQKVDTIVQKYAKKPIDMSRFFLDGRFDKEGYIKALSAQRDDKMTNSANIISKIYALLDKEQKLKLQTLVKAKQLMRQNRSHKGGMGDKNCNGRR